MDNVKKQAPSERSIGKKDLPVGMEKFTELLVVKIFNNRMDNTVSYGGKTL